MKFFTVPNMLTFGRIALLPWLWMHLWQHNFITATILFFILMSTDFLDGFLARRFSWHSKIGAALDPLADKLLVCGTLVVLVLSCMQLQACFLDVDSFAMLKALSWMLALKELAFVFGALYLFYKRIPLLPVTEQAKILTATEFGLLLYLFICQMYPALFNAAMFKFLGYLVAALVGSVSVSYAKNFYYVVQREQVMYEEE